MAPRYYLKDAANATVEVTDRINRKHPPTLKENAEEGATAMSTIVLADPDMDLDIHGLQPFWVIEDDSEATDNVIYGGFLGAQEISRGASDALELLGRVWSCEVVDANSLWNRRVMTGADNKRPAETDVARVQWLFTTAETGIWDDETTYVYTGSTHNMDAVDYRGQYRDQVIGDAAQASGKNWWTQLHEVGTGREWFVWYGKDSETGYSSSLYLTNDPTLFDDAALADGSSTVWPISEDTRLRSDPQRVYSGVYLRYEKGAIYRHDSVTTAAFCRRDYVADYPNVKTKTKAIARATRLLAKLDTQDDRITTTVRLPKGKATMIRAGMRVPFKATHLPGYDDDFYWMRVLSCAVTPHESGDSYDLALELAPDGNGAVVTATPTSGGIWYLSTDNLSVGTLAAWDVDWNATGDVHGPGYVDRFLDTEAFAYHLTSTYDDGFTVVAASATLNVRVIMSLNWSHTSAVDCTFTGSLKKNGSIVASQDIPFVYTGFGSTIINFDFTGTGIAAVVGDVITAHISKTGPAVGITIPSGTGAGTQMEILATSTVVI